MLRLSEMRLVGLLGLGLRASTADLQAATVVGEVVLHEGLHWLDSHVLLGGLVPLVVLVLVHGILLVVEGHRVLLHELLAGHAQALEEQVGLDSCNHVIFLLGDQVTGLDLEVFFILALGLIDVISQ